MEHGGKLLVRAEEPLADTPAVAISVIDNGCGMDEEIIQHVLKPLFTTDPGRFGMGLPIIRNIVNKHNGELEIKSKLRYGTTVKIYFPAVSQSNVRK